jgi:hypothetical protein
MTMRVSPLWTPQARVGPPTNGEDKGIKFHSLALLIFYPPFAIVLLLSQGPQVLDADVRQLHHGQRLLEDDTI